MRVLIVEDDPELADFLCRALREATWAVDQAASGPAGRLAHRTESDSVVTALYLPTNGARAPAPAQDR